MSLVVSRCLHTVQSSGTVQQNLTTEFSKTCFLSQWHNWPSERKIRLPLSMYSIYSTFFSVINAHGIGSFICYLIVNMERPGCEYCKVCSKSWWQVLSISMLWPSCLCWLTSLASHFDHGLAMGSLYQKSVKVCRQASQACYLGHLSRCQPVHKDISTSVLVIAQPKQISLILLSYICTQNDKGGGVIAFGMFLAPYLEPKSSPGSRPHAHEHEHKGGQTNTISFLLLPVAFTCLTEPFGDRGKSGRAH